MTKKTILISSLLAIFLISGCSQTAEPTQDQLPETEVTESDQSETNDTGVTTEVNGDILTITGPTELTLVKTKIPCSEYAFDSEICAADPTDSESIISYEFRFPDNSISDEIESEFNVTDYIGVGCVNENNLQGDLYTFDYPNALKEFQSNLTKEVSIEIDKTQPARGNIACLSMITKVNSIK